MPTERQTAELLDFIRRSSSPPPPVFVGRRNVIHDIESKMPDILKKESGSLRGVWHGEPIATRLLQGAPGSGKSSILTELERRSVELGKTDFDTHNVLVLSSEDLGNMEKVMKSISVAAGLSSRKWHGDLLKSEA